MGMIARPHNDCKYNETPSESIDYRYFSVPSFSDILVVLCLLASGDRQALIMRKLHSSVTCQSPLSLRTRRHLIFLSAALQPAANRLVISNSSRRQTIANKRQWHDNRNITRLQMKPNYEPIESLCCWNFNYTSLLVWQASKQASTFFLISPTNCLNERQIANCCRLS